MIVRISANLSDFVYEYSHNIYTANFIKISDIIPQIQQFKLQSSLFHRAMPQQTSANRA